MKSRSSIALFLIIYLVAATPTASSDDRRDDEGVSPVSNETYRQACGSCHFAYQPGLLPASNWAAILDDPAGHPGGTVSLDEKTQAEVRAYLLANSAEKSSGKRSRKISKYGVPQGVVRVSETPYIREKHDEISPEVFGRKAVGSRGNCPACHRGAERGYYDDDDVVIPK